MACTTWGAGGAWGAGPASPDPWPAGLGSGRRRPPGGGPRLHGTPASARPPAGSPGDQQAIAGRCPEQGYLLRLPILASVAGARLVPPLGGAGREPDTRPGAGEGGPPGVHTAAQDRASEIRRRWSAPRDAPGRRPFQQPAGAVLQGRGIDQDEAIWSCQGGAWRRPCWDRPSAGRRARPAGVPGPAGTSAPPAALVRSWYASCSHLPRRWCLRSGGASRRWCLALVASCPWVVGAGLPPPRPAPYSVRVAPTGKSLSQHHAPALGPL